MSFNDIVSFLKRDTLTLTGFLQGNDKEELGKVVLIDSEQAPLKFGITEHRKDFYYLPLHNAYLSIQTVVTNKGETKYYFAEWRLKRPIIC